MRIRTVKPEFWHNDKLSAIPAETALLALALINYADDEGYFFANPKLIEGTLFPLRELSLSIHGMLTELSNIGFIVLWEGSDGRKYGQIPGFSEHQKVNRPSKSKIASKLVSMQPIGDSLNTHGGLTEDSLAEQGTGNREQGTGKGVSPIVPKGTLRVEKNSHLRIEIGSWFGRKEATAWSEKELRAFRGLKLADDEDFELMRTRYAHSRPKGDDGTYRRTTVQTLLTNWTGELDKARNPDTGKAGGPSKGATNRPGTFDPNDMILT